MSKKARVILTMVIIEAVLAGSGGISPITG